MFCPGLLLAEKMIPPCPYGASAAKNASKYDKDVRWAVKHTDTERELASAHTQTLPFQPTAEISTLIILTQSEP